MHKLRVLGCLSGASDLYFLLGYGAAVFGNRFPTFRDNFLVFKGRRSKKNTGNIGNL